MTITHDTPGIRNRLRDEQGEEIAACSGIQNGHRWCRCCSQWKPVAQMILRGFWVCRECWKDSESRIIGHQQRVEREMAEFGIVIEGN